MPQPNSDAHIVSPPACDGMPYDPVDGDAHTDPWVKLDDNAGPASINTGRVTGGFQHEPGRWRQT